MIQAEPAARRAIVVLHYGTFGGPHNRFLNIHAPLAEVGVSLMVVLPSEEGDAAERFAAAGVPVTRLKLGRVRARPDPRLQLQLIRQFASDVRRLEDLIEAEKADAVILAGLANPHAAIAADRLNVPVIWQIVDSRVPAPAKQILMRSVRKRSDCTMFWGNRIQQMHGGTRLPMPTTLSNSPVDHERFQFSAEARRESRGAWGVPEHAPVVGMVANLNPQKGIEYFVRAAALVTREIPDTHFVVAGTRYATHADYTALLERELDELGVSSERFHFVGSRADVENALAAFDIKVISSVPASEGIPTTALEAMSVGVPVVTTDVGSAAEAVIDGVTGFVVSPQSEGAIATKVVDLLRDPRLRQRLGSAGRKWAIARFSIQRSVDDHLEAFRLARAFREARRARVGRTRRRVRTD